MSQASDYTLSLYKQFFGDNATDAEAINYLNSLGLLCGEKELDMLSIEKRWSNTKMRAAVMYLQEEWDY